MSLALLGVFVVQMYYIKESYRLKSQLFEQDVNQALTIIVEKIQKRNVIKHLEIKDIEFNERKKQNIRSQTDSIVAFKERFKENELQRKQRQQQEILSYLNTQDSIIRTNFYHPEIISEEDYATLSNPNPNNQTLDLRVNDVRSKDGTLLRRDVAPVFRRKKPIINLNKLPDSIYYLAFSSQDFLPKFIILPAVDPDLKAKFKLEDARANHRYKIELDRLYADTIGLYSAKNLMLVTDVAKEIERKDIPLQERIPDRSNLNLLVKNELLNKNINIDYDFWIATSVPEQKVIYRNASFTNQELIPQNTFKKTIFSNDLVTKDPGILYLNFPHKNTAILNNMLLMLLSSAGLLLVLLFIFTYTIYTIIKQKKLSEMKTDFINNMTHEFKTPVATIMIASEALKDPDMTTNKDRVQKLAGIIYDENARLGNHIERVLNVAKLDKKELKLEKVPMAVNDIISTVVDSMDLQLQYKGAHINLQLLAEPDMVIGDEMHFTNVMYNLIDNANKYSLKDPQITIVTKLLNQSLQIEVSDRGIGMTKEQIKKIFDQFYRVPTGNIHNVKGFGLGLSYVNDVISQMKGTIKVYSEKEKGTTFVINLPLKK